VGIAYAVVGWVIAQIAEFAFENFGAPDWVLKTVVVLLLLGLPLALFFAWDKFSDTAEPMPVSEPRAEAATNNDLPVSSPSELANKSVAVLPFVAMSSGADDEYFADGLTEEILNSLAQLPELLVTARTSAFSFKGQDIPVQENIAEQIAAAMDIVLDEQKREAMRQAGLRDAEAFTLYQKGLKVNNDAHGERDTIEGLLEANEYFEQVIDRVTNFSQVYIDHSDLFIHLLTLEAAENRPAGISIEDITGAYSSAIADYEAAVSNARSTEGR